MKTKRVIIISLMMLVAVAVGLGYFLSKGNLSSKTVKVGVLHSLTGTMAISEKSVAEATLLAMEEINNQGGVLGRKIVPIVVDGRSDWGVFATEAERLITEEKVSVVFGCWTSASRKMVKPIFEKYNNLLFYPVQYEGMEESPNIIYTGSAPNQQIIPAVKWCCENFGKRFFLVASDYVFPRAANAIIKDQASVLGAEIVGEEYVLLGNDDVQDVVAKINDTKPDVIINTINGSTNISFFVQLVEAGITADKIPVMSFSIAESELAYSKELLDAMYGHYACWNYFQTMDSAENRKFVAEFKRKYGSERVTDCSMEAGYFGVHLWAQAAKDAKSFKPIDVARFVRTKGFAAPEGFVYIDEYNQHTWKSVSIGRVGKNGQFDVVWRAPKPIHPVPYPSYRLKEEWDLLLDELYIMWGGNWANPGGLTELVAEKAKVAIELLEQLAIGEQLVADVVAMNLRNKAVTGEEIAQLDKRWLGLTENDLFIRQFLKSDLANKLLRFKKQNPQFIEIFITDERGLNIAMTNKVSDYFQADEKWWKDVAEKGNTLYGKVEYDKSAGIWGVAVVVPVFDIEHKIVGVIKAIVSIDDLIEKL